MYLYFKLFFFKNIDFQCFSLTKKDYYNKRLDLNYSVWKSVNSRLSAPAFLQSCRF